MVHAGHYGDKKFAEYGYGWKEGWNNYDNFYDEYRRQKEGNGTKPAPPDAPVAPVKPDDSKSDAKKKSSDLPPELGGPTKLHQKADSIEINGFKVTLNDLSSEDEDMDPELRSQDLTQMEEQGFDEAIES